jgi:hypothetical protein
MVLMTRRRYCSSFVDWYSAVRAASANPALYDHFTRSTAPLRTPEGRQAGRLHGSAERPNL